MRGEGEEGMKMLTKFFVNRILPAENKTLGFVLTVNFKKLLSNVLCLSALAINL